MANTALTRLQAGIESTAFTSVAATRIQYEMGGPPKEVPNVEFIAQARNMYEEYFDSAIGSKSAELELNAPALSFEDYVFWAELFLKGGVSPTGAGPYVWVHNGVATTEDTKTATIEGGDEVSAFKMVGATGKSMEISGKGGNDKAGLISAKYSLIGASADDASFTAALSDRTQTYMRFIDTLLYIDATPGNIGTTQVTTTFMGFTLKIDNKPSLIYFGDGTEAPKARAREKRHVELTLDLLFNSSALTQFQAMQARTRRYIQLKNTSGTNIWLWNFCGDFESFDWGDDGPTRRLSLMAKSIYDPTLGYSWQSSTTNSVAAV